MEDFLRNRITQLRINKGLSEYQLSYDLGHSRGYINNISSGKTLPSMTEFFSICDYFGITPSEFFDTTHEDPKLFSDLLSDLNTLTQTDLQLVSDLIKRLKSN